MKYAQELLIEIEKLQNVTLEFLEANRQANKHQGLPLRGRAALDIESALYRFLNRVERITRPEDYK